jgi:transcriptional regulator with XRE-family HTH domain
MDYQGGSTVPRRTLGIALRQARESAGFMVKDAANLLNCSNQTVWRMETGNASTKVASVMVLCDAYGVSDDMREALLGLAKESRSRGWWHAYGDVVPAWFELYVGLEQAASEVLIYEPSLVPGLLQSGDYMGAVIRADRPELSDDEVAKRIELKQSRQELLTRAYPPPPNLSVIMSEAALAARALPLGVMRKQLWHLLQTTQITQLSIRILPLTAGPHRASVTGAFTFLRFRQENGNTPPSTIYGENLTGAIYLDKPSEIEAYRAVWDSISSLALTEQQSLDEMKRILKELNDHES